MVWVCTLQMGTTNGVTGVCATKLGARDDVAWAIQLGATNSQAGVCAIQVGVING